jgi:hypothetical protein
MPVGSSAVLVSLYETERNKRNSSANFSVRVVVMFVPQCDEWADIKDIRASYTQLALIRDLNVCLFPPDFILQTKPPNLDLSRNPNLLVILAEGPSRESLK